MKSSILQNSNDSRQTWPQQSVWFSFGLETPESRVVSRKGQGLQAGAKKLHFSKSFLWLLDDEPALLQHIYWHDCLLSGLWLCLGAQVTNQDPMVLGAAQTPNRKR